MAFLSLKQFLSRIGVGSVEQFDEWSSAWRVAVESGSQETLLAFICRECGLTEEGFLQRLAQALNWPYLDLPKVTVPAEARNRISTKVAFQYSILPTLVSDGSLQVAVSNPFDTAMLNAVRFDARGPVQFALAPKPEIEKALKKYYGVGAETLDGMEKADEPLDLELPADKEITESDQEARTADRYVHRHCDPWEHSEDHVLISEFLEHGQDVVLSNHALWTCCELSENPKVILAFIVDNNDANDYVSTVPRTSGARKGVLREGKFIFRLQINRRGRTLGEK